MTASATLKRRAEYLNRLSFGQAIVKEIKSSEHQEKRYGSCPSTAPYAIRRVATSPCGF